MCGGHPRQPVKSAAGSGCRPGAQTLQRTPVSSRAMPQSWTGALRTVVAPTADVPVHQPGHQLPALPVPTLCPGADPPLPFCSEARPPSATSSASTAQGSSTTGGTMEATSPPGSRSGSRYRPGDGAGRRRDPADGGSRNLRGCRSLCHAPDPPGGDGRRKRGGGGSSSRAAPAPARGGEAAGAGLGEGAGSSGAEACAKRGNMYLPFAGTQSWWGLIPELQQLHLGCGVQQAWLPGATAAGHGNGAAEEETGVKETWACVGGGGLTFWPASVRTRLHLADTVIKCEKKQNKSIMRGSGNWQPLLSLFFPPVIWTHLFPW